MVPDGFNAFFAACGGVAGALIGLLFVAISVSADRLAREETASQMHRVRAAAALTAFTNSLAVSLFSLIPGHKIGDTAVSVAAVGLVFVAGALLSMFRLHLLRWRVLLDALFLVGLALVFASQLWQGIDLLGDPHDVGAVDTIAILVVICFLIGIARSWELIGGPSIGLRQEVSAMILKNQPARGQPADEPGE
ncbi:MAG TPA: hypothetical protein VGH27_07540 [Streptosporangiaceae bacterium]|jgi:hypothetical protein